jgi:hypothetical protein
VRFLRLISMRYICPVTVVAFSILAPAAWMFGQASAPGLVAADATVGQNLEAFVSVSLNGPVPPAGLPITLTSNDPSRLLLSRTPDAAGATSLVINLEPGMHYLGVFLQGLDKNGTATYTASAPGFSSGTGKVTLAPSGIVIGGPFGVSKPSFRTTTGAPKTRIAVYAALLDSSLKYVAPQQVAGGRPVNVNVASSNTAIGTITTSAVKIGGGSTNATTLFQPVTEGDTALSVNVPSGFSTPAEFTTVTAKVTMPGIVVTEDITIGKNLQQASVVGLNEPAPAGGLAVTLTCTPRGQVLLSATGTEKGSESLTIKMPPGESQASYYVQALGGSGQVICTGVAPGYHDSRAAKLTLAPSGVIVAGPLSFTRAGGSPGFVTGLGEGKPTAIVVYTVFLDPVSHRSADVTVQPLRAGVSITVALNSSDPSVGTIVSPVTIPGAANQGPKTWFTPLKAGTTTVSVVTPEGYTASANATALKAIVTP